MLLGMVHIPLHITSLITKTLVLHTYIEITICSIETKSKDERHIYLVVSKGSKLIYLMCACVRKNVCM